MTKWIYFSILIHVFLIFWVVAFVKAPATGIYKKKPADVIREQKVLFERKRIGKMNSRIDQIQQIKNEMIMQRNKRIERLLEYEEQMHKRLPDQFEQVFENVNNSKNQVLESDNQALKQLGKLNNIQAEMSKLAGEEQFNAAAAKTDSVLKYMDNIGRFGKESLRELDITTKYIKDVNELAPWLSEDSLRKNFSDAQKVQGIAREDLRNNVTQFEKYQQDIQKSVSRIDKTLGPKSHTSEISGLKKWIIRKNLEKITQENKDLQRLQSALEKQKRVDQILNESIEASREMIKKQKFYSTQLKELVQDSLAREKNTEINDLYRETKALEREIEDIYKQTRAAELAMINETTFAETFSNIGDSVSNEYELNEKNTFQDLSSKRELEKYKQSFNNITREMNSIFASVNKKNKMLSNSQTSVSENGAQAGSSGMNSQISNFRNLRRLSQETSGRVQDLSGAMRKAMYTEASDGRNGTPYTSASNNYQNSQPPALNTFTNTFGQKLTQNGRPAIWFYVGNWYIIGPFPNEKRSNITTPFPPEAVIDLDAEYTGKDGKSVNWQYISSPSCLIIPPQYDEYAIFYAYTEIYCDIAQDVWLTLGSDDRSDMWINELPVWKSSNQLKPWMLDEGFRKVHLLKGHNKILIRIENGWRECCFSLLVSTRPS